MYQYTSTRLLCTASERLDCLYYLSEVAFDSSWHSFILALTGVASQLTTVICKMSVAGAVIGILVGMSVVIFVILLASRAHEPPGVATNPTMAAGGPATVFPRHTTAQEDHDVEAQHSNQQQPGASEQATNEALPPYEPAPSYEAACLSRGSRDEERPSARPLQSIPTELLPYSSRLH